MSPLVVLVTGSSTGLGPFSQDARDSSDLQLFSYPEIGRALVDEALNSGHTVVATLRTPSVLDSLAATFGPNRLFVLALDVTQKDQIASAFAQAIGTFGKIDAIISNAGVAVLAEGTRS